jgi:glycosyltransferase involved in cell wall biosynthesis
LVANGSDPNLSRPDSRAEGRLLVDATGALLNFGGAPTGIPRVEDFLVRAALSDPDARVGAVKFSRRLRRFRFLHDSEREQLLRMHADVPPVSAEPRASLLRQALSSVRDYPAAGREADRYLADMVTSGRRRGVDFQAAKALLRAYRAYRRIRGHVARPAGLSRVEPGLGGSDTVLLCNTTVLGSSLPQALAGPARAAVICHDLIPILQPGFAVNTDHARRFSESLDRLVQARATLLCASRWTADGLAAHLAERGAAARVGRFPMPSILCETEGCSPPCAAAEAEPFILYCSTVEVRKNHLLLARVWQQALAAGIRLPKLVCVGKWGWGTGALDAYLRSHPELAASIVFTGPIGDAELAEKYRRALFGVFPSRMEGWGYGASECLDFGLPVIVSTAPALIEATGGLMPAIDPDDAAGWGAMIARLASDETLRARLRDAIRARHRPVSAEASWTAIKGNFFPDRDALAVSARHA